MKSRKRLIFRILGIVVLAVVVLLVVLRAALPSLGVAVANGKLPDLLTAEASIGAIDLALLRGRAGVRAIRIGQPPGFGDGDFLSLGNVSADVCMASLRRAPLTIEDVTVEDLAVHVVRDAEGRLNAASLAKPKEGPPEEQPADEGESKPLLLARLAVRNLSVTYTDHALAKDGEPLEVRLQRCDIVLTNLVIDAARSAEEAFPGGLALTAVLDQGALGKAHLGVASRLGAIGGGIPAVNAVVRLVGLELEALPQVVPSGTAQSLGGGNLDLHADVRVGPELLDCAVELVTAGNTLKTGVGGTPAKPEFDTSSVLFILMGRSLGALGNLAGNMGDAGLAVAGTAVDTVAGVGKGAMAAAGKAGGGLLKTVQALAKADVGGVVGGLTDATVGTATEAVGAVTDGAKTLGSGAARAASETTGSDEAEAWRSGAGGRWSEKWSEAQVTLSALAYPKP